MRLLLIPIIVALFIGAIALQPHTIRKYAVRENISPAGFELWCWSDLSNGSVKKHYIGSFNGNLGVERVETSLCH